MLKKTLSFTFVFLIALAISGEFRTPDADATNNDSEREKITDALNLVFDYVYSDKDKGKMTDIQFFDTDEFLGYECQFYVNGKPINPWRIEFYGTSKDDNYYLFWLNERVHYDGEFDHAVTGDFFAVAKKTKEIIAERDGKMPHEWKENFPW